jgi:phosphohistidine phosphatase
VKRLFLLRHAKSSWSDPERRDDERPLAPRGRRATGRLAAHLRREDVRPELVLCSPARRTVETLERITPAFGGDVAVRIADELYGASGDEITDLLREVPDTVSEVMVVGHNPGIETAAVRLAGEGEPGALERLRTKFPTGALATLSVPTAMWRELGPGRARLIGFVVPRELA